MIKTPRTMQDFPKREEKKKIRYYQSISQVKRKRYAYVSSKRLQDLKMSIAFKDKKENINALQLADLIAYPMARS